MKGVWPGLALGFCLLLPQQSNGKDNPTAECSWLHERIKVLEKAIKQGDELGTYTGGTGTLAGRIQQEGVPALRLLSARHKKRADPRVSPFCFRHGCESPCPLR